MTTSTILVLFAAATVLCCAAVPTRGGDGMDEAPAVEKRQVVYREVDGISLELTIFEPAGEAAGARPAIVLFHGGGWRGGSPDLMYRYAEPLAGDGMVAISAEYRIENRHGATPFDAVHDAKAAMRWVRAHAAELNIDPERIAAGGSSAGAHLAAAAATVPGLDPEPDATVSCVPNALLLLNPVYDNGPEGFGHDRVGERYREISPMHNIGAGMPPTVVMLGTEDRHLSVERAETFQARMREMGARSELVLYEGAKHGFWSSEEYFPRTLADMRRFLASLGYIEADDPAAP